MSMYQELSARGFSFENAPRANPRDKLNEPYILRRVRDGKIVMRGYSRDNLETKAHKFLAQLMRAETFSAAPTDMERAIASARACKPHFWGNYSVIQYWR